MSLQVLRFEDLRARDNNSLDRDFFNRRYRLIAESLAKLRDAIDGLDEASNNLVTLGLARIDDVLGPALATVQAAAARSFLVAPSADALTLTAGLTPTFTISDEALWPTFAPTPYVLINRDADAAVDDWALARTTSYDEATGQLVVEIVSSNGTLPTTEYSDWVISATAGLGESILTAASDLPALRDEAQAAAAAAEQAALDAQAVLDSGPVVSVNGKVGTVSLVMGDIPNLVTTLGGKADAQHGHDADDAIDGGTY